MIVLMILRTLKVYVRMSLRIVNNIIRNGKDDFSD